MIWLRCAFLFQIVLCTVINSSAHATAAWVSDLPAALSQAKADRKSVLVHFSGSDWCGWCIKLRKDVFSKAAFEAYARSNLILVRIDFPKRLPQSAALRRTNQQVAERFQVRGYPTLILLDCRGNQLGIANYGQGGARSFLAEVEKIIHPRQDLAPTPTVVSKSESSSAKRTPQRSIPGLTFPNLTLQRISGPKGRRRVMINNRVLAKGETASVQATSGQVRVRCVEIKETSVIVTLNGGGEKHELRMARGT